MKKLIALILVLAALLTGCGHGQPEETQVPTTAAVPETTQAPTTEPATVPTTEPAPVYVNPLNGRQIDEPFTGRIFAFSIGNTKESLPHYGVSKCDLLFETFVNGLTTRRFAMFGNVADVQAIGGSRSMRVQFTDLCQGYDAIGVHAAGSSYVLSDMKQNGIDNIHSEQWDADFHYRDKDRMRNGYSMEHCLFVRGADVWQYAQDQGMRVTQDPDKDYGLHFSDTPSTGNGETAEVIDITFILSKRQKPTIMTYHPDYGAYTMQEYGIDTVDGLYNGEPELFKNVFALYFPYHYEGRVFHVPETLGEGQGYFACDGKIVPIQWHREDDYSPFTFTLADGSPVQQGVGTSYIAMIPTDSTVEWKEAEVPVTEAEETLPAAETAAESSLPNSGEMADPDADAAG